MTADLPTLTPQRQQDQAWLEREAAGFRTCVQPHVEAVAMFPLGMAPLQLNDTSTAVHATERMDELTVAAKPLGMRSVQPRDEYRIR